MQYSGNNGNWKRSDADNYSFLWKGTEIYPQAYYLSLSNIQNNYRGVVVLTKGKYHLIVSMSLGWKMQLKEII